MEESLNFNKNLFRMLRHFYSKLKTLFVNLIVHAFASCACYTFHKHFFCDYIDFVPLFIICLSFDTTLRFFGQFICPYIKTDTPYFRTGKPRRLLIKKCVPKK